jgi:hypothetical protein
LSFRSIGRGRAIPCPTWFRKAPSGGGTTPRLSTTATEQGHRGGERGQSLVELALLLPILLTLALGIIEGAVLYRTYSGIVNATWIGARLALDGGSDADIVSLIQYSGSGFSVTPGKCDIYVVRGATNSAGAITTWTTTHPFGSGGASPNSSRTDLQGRLQTGLGTLNATTYADVQFVMVELDYSHSSATGSWVLPVTLPMRSYAVLQTL